MTGLRNDHMEHAHLRRAGDVRRRVEAAVGGHDARYVTEVFLVDRDGGLDQGRIVDVDNGGNVVGLAKNSGESYR